MSIVELTANNFDQIIDQNDLVVVDFWAEWCAPCQSFQKIIEELASRHTDVVFGSIDIEAQKALADEFHVASVPAVMILRQQVIVCAETGLMTASNLSDLIDQARAIDPQQLEDALKESE